MRNKFLLFRLFSLCMVLVIGTGVCPWSNQLWHREAGRAMNYKKSPIRVVFLAESDGRKNFL